MSLLIRNALARVIWGRGPWLGTANAGLVLVWLDPELPEKRPLDPGWNIPGSMRNWTVGSRQVSEGTTHAEHGTVYHA